MDVDKIIILYLYLRGVKFFFVILKFSSKKREERVARDLIINDNIAIFVVLFAFSLGYILNQLLTIMEVSF